MKICVTGAAGFIGGNFVYYMLENHPDYDIVGLDLLTYAGNLETLEEAMKNPHFKFTKGDIADREYVYDLFEKEKFDIVVNFAAESHVDRSITDPESFVRTNVMGTTTLLDAFVGNVGGCIGEISALALLLGGVYLIARGVIRARIPVAYIATVAVLTFIFPKGDADRLAWMLYQLFTGGLFLGAFFMATDYVTSPVTKKGEIIYGIGCGLLTVFIRYFGGYPEGVSYSILIMNCCVWLIDKVGKPNRYGVTKEMRAAEKAAKKAGKEG